MWVEREGDTFACDGRIDGTLGRNTISLLRFVRRQIATKWRVSIFSFSLQLHTQAHGIFTKLIVLRIPRLIVNQLNYSVLSNVLYQIIRMLKITDVFLDFATIS